MKAYEILPAGMTGSALKGGGDVKEPKPYEILPGAGTAVQGLVGWMKGSSSIARDVARHGAFSKQAIGLPYDPAGASPAHGVNSAPLMGKQPKPYEILPGSETTAQGHGGRNSGCGGKSSGCGCGGSCGGESPIPFTASARTKMAPAPMGGMDLGSLPQPIFGPGGGGQGPGASLCGSIRQRIQWLRDEIDQRMQQLGPRAGEIAEAWRRARQICSTEDPQSLCALLVAVQEQAGRRLPPPGVDDPDAVHAYNAAWGAALGCRDNESGMALAGRRFFGCMTAIGFAQGLERRAAGEMKMSPPVSYLHDIEPLERELSAALVELASCERSVSQPASSNPDWCVNECNDPRWGWWERGYSSCSRCCAARCGNHIDYAICDRTCSNIRS